MISEENRIWVIGGAVLAVIALLLVFGRARKELEPEPVAAWVAIEAGDEGLARAGRVEAPADTPFTLHAVVEARNWRGETLYYTEARRLELRGVEVPPEALRPWRRAEPVRVLWFTVSGSAPYLEVSTVEDLGRFGLRELFRSDWPQTWSIPGTPPPASEARGQAFAEAAALPFGTQRFHARVEIFGPERGIVPRYRLRSPGVADLPGSAAEVPTLVRSLPATLRLPSRLFGLAQIEPQPSAPREVLLKLDEWMAEGIAFSRLAMLRRLLDSLGADIDALRFDPVAIDGTVPWRVADLLRAGQRWVLTHEDRGVEGRLDDKDLCFDFDKGATVRRLGEIFTGDGWVERARLDETATGGGASDR